MLFRSIIFRLDPLQTNFSSLSNLRKVGSHEVYHVFQEGILADCNCTTEDLGAPLGRWYLEGAAEYVGYADTWGTSSATRARIQKQFLSIVRDPKVSVPLRAVSTALSGVSTDVGIDAGRVYPRAYFAVQYLIDRFGEDLVLNQFYGRVVAAGDWCVAFQQSFGLTEDQFDAQFQAWLTTLK